MVNFRDIQTYWNNKQPGRKIAKNFSENNNPKRFFELIDNYRFHRNNYQYLINGDFFNHSDYDGKDILEIGCGLGADLQKFAESGSKVFAIDAAPSSYNSLCRRFELINKEFKFEVADFKSLPFEDSKFDLIYSFGVLHHSPWIKDGILEASRVLKKNGHLIIMLYHKGFKYYVKKIFFRGIIQGKFVKNNIKEVINNYTEEFGGSPTTLVFSRKEAEELLKENFYIKKVKVFKLGDNIKLPFFGEVHLLRLILPRFLYNFITNQIGWNLMIQAVKK
tara:strand:- start:34458 stop:35288 length:831 start_codon:yes stop_codon:yes gene_type:complete